MSTWCNECSREPCIGCDKSCPVFGLHLDGLGEWRNEIGDIHSSGRFIYCSICGKHTWAPKRGAIATSANFEVYDNPKYCPNCGTEMEK